MSVGLPEDEVHFCGRCHRQVRRSWRTTPRPINGQSDNRLLVAVRHWPDGYICSGCFAKACETYGRCSGCGAERLVPGIAPDGGRQCTDCAGDLGDFTCRRCGQEGWNHYRHICGRCVLAERLAEVLDDGTGAIRPALVPFFEAVCRMSRPRSGILWLRKPAPVSVLRALARGDVPLTHEGLGTLSPWRSVIYVRDLLIDCDVLPPVDRFLLLFEHWLPDWLATINDLEHRKILERFASWHVLRRLRLIAAEQPIGNYRANNARLAMRLAATFLDALAARGRQPAECTQADIDLWFTRPRSTADQLRGFLCWCIEQRELPRLQLPQVARAGVSPISQDQRIAAIRRVIIDENIPDGDRVLAMLVLLYAQPLSRITRLTIDDVVLDQDHVFIRLGDPPVPVPQPFAVVLSSYLASRPNLATATNPGSRLLFPGRRAGQPMHTTSMRLRLQRLGLPNLDGRTAAIRQLLLQAPASVVAGMLGYHPAGAEVLAAEAGSTWKHYAGGDRTPRREPRVPSPGDQGIGDG